MPDLGPVAVGRGTAFVARADNLSAFYYNPAGLSKSKGIHILAGGTLVDCNVEFTRSGSGQFITINDLIQVEDPALDYSDPLAAQSYRTVTQQTPVAISAAELVVNWGDAFSVEGLSISLGLLAPSTFRSPSYPKAGPSRYSVRTFNTMVIYPGVGISYSFNRFFSIGAVFLSGMGFVEKSQASRPQPVLSDRDHNEDLQGDAVTRIDVQDLFMPSGIVGALSQPFAWLELGVSFRTPVIMKAEGKLSWEPAEQDLPASFLPEGKDKVVLNQHFPWVVSAGVRYIHRVFDIEMDFVWENWGTYQGMDIGFEAELDLYGDGSGFSEMSDQFIPKYWQDTYSVRLGSDIEVWPDNLTLRVGGLYQSSAHTADNSTFSLDFPFGQQFGIGFGFTWHVFGFLDMNAGYLHLFQTDVKVERGRLQQTGNKVDLVGQGNEEDMYGAGNIINNGDYKVNLNFFAISLEAHF